jgi:hypothetical protein
MKEIELTQGQWALVDDEDYEFLNQWKWYAHKRGNTYYAVRGNKNKIKDNINTISMHREIVILSPNMEVDHIDGNGLNNQKYNLRICFHNENMLNQGKRNSRNPSSKYIGVFMIKSKYKDKEYFYWTAQITLNGRKKYLGTFKTELDAAIARDLTVIENNSSYHKLNFESHGKRGQ